MIALKNISAAGALFINVLSASSFENANATWPTFAEVHKAEYPDEVRNTIMLGKNLPVTVIFAITNKANGSLELPGLGIRIYDQHADGVIYRDGLLTCQWKDTDGDGLLELLVEGIAQFFEEKSERMTSEKTIRGIFRYLPQDRRFEVISCAPEIHCWKR